MSIIRLFCFREADEVCCIHRFGIEKAPDMR